MENIHFEIRGKVQRVSRVRAKIAWISNQEYGISMAEIGRQLGVYTVSIAKANRKREENDRRC